MPPIRWDDRTLHLANSFADLFRNLEFTDCILDADGGSIKVHRIILAACSPYFKKLLKNHHAGKTIPVKDIKYKDLKLILDLIYYGEVDVPVTKVASVVKTADLMEMSSLKLSISHCEFSCNNTCEPSVKNGSSVTGVNHIKKDEKDLIVKQIPPVCILPKSEERLLSEVQNFHLHSVDGLKTQSLNYFQDLSEMLKKDQPKSAITNSIDIFKGTSEDDNVNNVLFPLTFVSVPPVSDAEKLIDDDQYDMSCCDLKDPLGECSSNFDVSKERSIKCERTFESVPQVKREPKEEIDIPESVILVDDKHIESCHKFTNTEYNLFHAPEQESGMKLNLVNVLGSTFCSESFAAEETHDMEIKMESIFEISGTSMKEEKSSETCFKSSVDDDTETQQLKHDYEPVKCGAQHNSIIDYQQDVNEEVHATSTYKRSTICHTETVNKTPANYETCGSTLMEMKLRSMGKKLEKRTKDERADSHSMHNTCVNPENGFEILPRDALHMQQLRGRKEKNGNVEISSKLSHPRFLQTHSGDKTFQCEICKSSFPRKHQLIVHIRTHTGDKPFECDICKKSFNLKVNLAFHKLIHTGEKPYKCDFCSTSFRHKSHLEDHKRTHTGVKPFQCEICKSSFNRKSHIIAHMRTHSGEKPFKCEICETSFSHKHRLHGHMQTHTGEKPFPCKICKTSFAQKSYLIQHMKVHTADKPFQCEICKSSFRHKCDLIQHIRVHTGEKPFQCKVCKTSFGRRSSLRCHMKAHTRKNM